MNFCTSDTCKLLVMLLVIVISGYLVATNKREGYTDAQQNPTQPQASTEDQIKSIYQEVYGMPIPQAKLDEYKIITPFDPVLFKDQLTKDKTATIEAQITKVFNDQVKRDPTPDELSKYTDKFRSGTMSSDQLVRLLAHGPETIEDDSTRKSVADNTKKVKDYDVYKTIIQVYNTTLDRLPNSAELSHYYKLINSDKTFTQEKLADVLLASREHEILEKNQVNAVHGELPGNITERQLEITVSGIYATVFNQQPDKATYTFVRGKFVEFELNEEKLIRFLKQLKSAEDAAISTGSSAPVSANANSYTDQGQGQSPNQNPVSKYVDQQPSIGEYVMTKGVDLLEHNTVNIYDPALANANTPNKITGTGSPDTTTTANVMNTLQKPSQCGFNKNNIEQAIEANDKQAYADLVNSRNNDNCIQYINADSNMKLFPEFKWSVPEKRQPICYSKNNVYQPLSDQTALIGTLLSDARKTNVGSVMPLFPPRA